MDTPAPSRQLPQRPIVRPLFPERVARRDRQFLLRAMAGFLTRYGYYPTHNELASATGAQRAAVYACLEDLVALEVIERFNPPGRRPPYWQLTPKGWQVLGLRPVQPWVRRPSKPLDRLVYRVAISLADVEAAQRKLDQELPGRIAHAGKRRRIVDPADAAPPEKLW